jgi:triosephosphate isomerase (TIM)
MIFVNFKTYLEGSGENAKKLALIMEQVSSESQIKLIPVVQAGDVREIVQTVKLEVWVQHVDLEEYGAHTGATLPESVMEDGATGTFLNHSEHRFESFEALQKANARAKSVGLKTLIFAGNTAQLISIVSLNPDFVSYEPPELVGSTSTSVSKEKPEIISEAVEIAKKKSLPLIVGAGIKSEEDVRKSLELGASGFAIAKSIVTSANPKEELLNLIKGYQ